MIVPRTGKRKVALLDPTCVPTGSDGVYVEIEKDSVCKIYNIFGENIDTVSLKQGVSKINVPNGAMGKIY